MLSANDSVRAEADAVRAFQCVLEQERDALIRGDAEQVERLSMDKASIAHTLEAATATRQQALSVHYGGADRTAIATWLAADESAPPIWEDLMRQADAMRELNRVNGMLIERHLLRARRSLSMLGEMLPGGLPLYGANGLPNVSNTEIRRITA